MSAKTKTEQVLDALSKYSTIEDMRKHQKEIAKKIECSSSLVWKQIKKLEKEKPKDVLPEGQVAVIKVEKATEIEVEPEPEDVKEVEDELPKDEYPPTSEEDELEEKEKEEIEEEREKRLGDIFVRSLQRIFDIPVDQLGLSAKIGLTKQEAEDSSYLILLLLAKHTDVEAEENLLEITTVTHFGGLVGRGLAEWWKKRQEEKAEKEEEKSESSHDKIDSEPSEEPVPIPILDEKSLIAKSEEEKEKLKKSQQPNFMKRL